MLDRAAGFTHQGAKFILTHAEGVTKKNNLARVWAVTSDGQNLSLSKLGNSANIG